MGSFAGLAFRARDGQLGHTGLRKSLGVELAERGSAVRLQHRIENQGTQKWELAPWALTVMAPGGVIVLPQEELTPFPDALSPARPLVLWP
jgi:hypothetical protein